MWPTFDWLCPWSRMKKWRLYLLLLCLLVDEISQSFSFKLHLGLLSPLFSFFFAICLFYLMNINMFLFIDFPFFFYKNQILTLSRSWDLLYFATWLLPSLASCAFSKITKDDSFIYRGHFECISILLNAIKHNYLFFEKANQLVIIENNLSTIIL